MLNVAYVLVALGFKWIRILSSLQLGHSIPRFCN